MEENKGEDIVLLDIHEVADFADFFIIVSGSSDRLMDVLAENVMEKVKQSHKQRGRLEGISSAGWMVIDFGDTIVHLFSPDQREYYQLEQLWSKGKTLVRLQ